MHSPTYCECAGSLQALAYTRKKKWRLIDNVCTNQRKILAFVHNTSIGRTNRYFETVNWPEALLLFLNSRVNFAGVMVRKPLTLLTGAFTMEK